LLSRRAGWRGPFFLFVFGASSLLVCFSWLVVRHDSIAYRHSDGTSIFRVVSSCFAGTDAVHPYTATSRVRFIRGPVVTRKRRGVGRQRVIARSDYLTQTEYLEETVLRAEARSCAGRRSCSHPWDGQVYLYTWLYRSEASVCCHCFCFSAFDIIKAVQLLLWQAIAFLFPRPSALFGG
jgi:hypothetical protein